MKVLIADDDKELSQFLKMALHNYGWEVNVAFDAIQALVTAKNWKPDVIVLDINMPAGTGIGALEKIRKNMDTSMIPVLILSGSQDPEIKDKTKALGALGYMHKPVEVEDLHLGLQQVVNGVHLEF